MSNTIRVPSGEMRAYVYARGVVVNGSSRPCRLIQTTDVCGPVAARAAPGTYIRVPDRDIEYSASAVAVVETPSTTETGSPVTSSLSRSNGTARSDPVPA